MIQAGSGIFFESFDGCAGDGAITCFFVNLIDWLERYLSEVAILLSRLKRIFIDHFSINELSISAIRGGRKLEHFPLFEVFPETRPSVRGDVMRFINNKYRYTLDQFRHETSS